MEAAHFQPGQSSRNSIFGRLLRAKLLLERFVFPPGLLNGTSPELLALLEDGEIETLPGQLHAVDSGQRTKLRSRITTTC